MARQAEIIEKEPVRDGRRSEIASGPLAPLEAILTGRRWRLAARWIGVLFFFLGAALLLFVFSQALMGFGKFSKPGYIQLQVNTIAGDGSQIWTAYISVVGGHLLQLMYLLLLGYLGSLISTKGIQFFAASESVIDEAVVGVNEEQK